MKKIIGIAIAIGIGLTSPSLRADEAARMKIREAMRKLAPLVGKWDATWKFHDTDGTVSEDPGSETIVWALDETYLQFEWEHHNQKDPTRSRKVLSFVTFNPASNQYESTYFYNGSALRVSDVGEYDPARRELRTRGYIPLEDGINDEVVRTFTNLTEPDRILYTHFSRRSPAESCERMDLEIILRKRPSPQ